MFNEKLATCPARSGSMEKGFSARASGLSWVPLVKMKQFAFCDNDLNEAGFSKYLPSRAAYDLSYHCPRCKIYIVDYSRSFSRKKANAVAEAG